MSNVICPVCGEHVFPGNRDNTICPICGWENDGWYEDGGANYISLEDYRKRFIEYKKLYPDYTYSKYGLPEMTEDDRLTVDHLYCTSNEEDLSRSDHCGCFYCLNIFEPYEVNSWIKDRGGRTAICPYCGIDSVLPDSMVELSEEYLKKMHKRWF